MEEGKKSRSSLKDRVAFYEEACGGGSPSKESSGSGERPSSPRSDSTRGSQESLFERTTVHFSSKVHVDVHIRRLKDEQERVQKKTFVNWINSYLSKRSPPLRVEDLIEDLKDGTKLLALLEVLSGEKLPTEKGRNLRRPHFLSNANTALTFLQSKRIKLVNINSSDLVDGRPPVVLGLIWTIILYFQIEENTRALASLGHNFGGSTSSLEGTRTPDPATERRRRPEPAKQALLKWVTNALPKDIGLEVRDFGPSWRDGLAFLAIVDAIKKGLIDLSLLRRATNRDRLETAFDLAERELGIARLLDPEDLDVERPDEKSVMTYVAQFLHKYPELRSDSGERLSSIESEYKELRSWLLERTQYLSDPSNLHLDLSMRHWLWLLDSQLPEPFCRIGEWLYRAENLLEDNEIPLAMNEETAGIISRKLEEHKAFFCDLPPVQEQFHAAISRRDHHDFVHQQQLDIMARRLNEIGPKAAVRRIRLKFLEHKCCLIAFMVLTENKVKSWTVKYGNEQKVQQLLDQYKNFVSRNKIFQEFNKAFVDMQHVVEEYKAEGNIDQREGALVDRFMRDTAERWKGVCMELRCVQSMLEEVLIYWKKWNVLHTDIQDWLHASEPKLSLDEEGRMEYFQDIGVWKEKYQLLGDTVSFLIATTEDQIAAQLKEQYRLLTAMWEFIFSNTKQYMEAGEMLRHRREYKQAIEKLQAWLREAENILDSPRLESTEKIKAHIEQLKILQGELNEIEELFKVISKKFQTLIQDLSREDVDKMMNVLKKEKESILRLRARIGMQSQLLHQLLIQQQSLETCQKEISVWLDSAEDFLSQLNLGGEKEVLQAKLEKHKAFFSKTLYYKSMLDSKNKVLTTLLVSLKNAEGVDTREFEAKMLALNQRFSKIIHDATTWEQALLESIRGWKNLKEVERVINEWVQAAEKLMNEKHIDSEQTLENHKNTISQGPTHLIRMEFILKEQIFHRNIKEIEKELNLETRALNKNENFSEIITRNKELLEGKLTFEVKKCLEEMKACVHAVSQHPKEEAALSEAFHLSEVKWQNLLGRIYEFEKQLQIIPDQWSAYKTKFIEMEKWMDSVDISIKNLLQELSTAEEFENERLTFQTLDTLASHGANPAEEQAKLDQLLTRYKKLIPVIEMTVVRTELYSKCYTYKREVSEVCELLERVTTSSKCEVERPEVLNEMLVAQETAVASLDAQRPNIVAMLQRGRTLSKESSAPQFISQDVTRLESTWNRTYTTTLDKLNILKSTQKTWELYTNSKNDIMHLLEKAEIELSKATKGVGSANVAEDLRAKQELCSALRIATEDILKRLRLYTKELATIVPHGEKVFLAEVSEIKVDELQKEVSNWIEYETGVRKVKSWAVETAPVSIGSLSIGLAPEERIVKSTEILQQAQLSRQNLEQLKKTANVLLRGNKAEIQGSKAVMVELNDVDDTVAAIEKAIAFEKQELERGTIALQKFEVSSAKIKPWLEKVEVETSMGIPKPIVLDDAKEQLQQAKLFLKECTEKKQVLDEMSQLMGTLPPESLAINTVDIYVSRWTALESTARARAEKMEKLVAAWSEMEATAGQIHDWLHSPVFQAILQNPEPREEDGPIEMQLMKLKELKEELLQGQSNITKLGQAADVIASGLAVEGATFVKTKVGELKAVAVSISNAINQKANLLAEMSIAREDLNNDLKSAELWVIENENVLEAEVSPETVNSVLEMYHMFLQEHAEKQPLLTDVGERIHKAEHLIPNYENLLSKYQDLMMKVELQRGVVEKWREVILWVKSGAEVIDHISHQLETNCPLQEVEKKLKSVEEELAAWSDAANTVEHLIHESKVTVIHPMPSEIIKELFNKVHRIRAQLDSKKEMANKLGELWHSFQENQEHLSSEILNSQSAIEELFLAPSNCSQLEESIKVLDDINEKHKANTVEKEQLFNKGHILLNEDKKNAATIQNILASIDLNWDKVSDRIKEYKIVLNDMLNAWNDFKNMQENCHDSIESVKMTIEGMAVPSDLASTATSYDKCRKALDTLDDTKVVISRMENKLQMIRKYAKTLPNFSTTDVENNLSKLKADWKETADNTMAKLQDLESQAVIWKQVEEVKEKLCDWLDNMHQSLQSCIDSPSDTESVNIIMRLYENEYPEYKQLKENISEKGKQLAQCYDIEYVPNIQSVETMIQGKFDSVEKLYSQINNNMKSYSESENKVKDMVKQANNKISNIREKIAKCDNLNGEIPVILERLKLCRSLKDSLKEFDVCAIESEFHDITKDYPNFSNPVIGKEISVLQKRYADIALQADKVESNLMNFLIKYHNEKLSALKRSVSNYKEKIIWCIPEIENDRNGLEAKLSSLSDMEPGLKECNDCKNNLQISLQMLMDVGCGKEGEHFQTEQQQLSSILEETNRDYAKCHENLKQLLSLWENFEHKFDKLNNWLREVENNVKAQSLTHTDLCTISTKIRELEPIKKQLDKIEPLLSEIDEVNKQLGENCDNTRTSHQITALKSKYQTILKSVSSYSDRLNSVKSNYDLYHDALIAAQNWISSSSSSLDSIKERLKSRVTTQIYKELLQDLKSFNSDRDKGQALLNNAIQSGEALFVEITPDNREVIRNELRNLRDSSEALIDQANAISKTIEGALLKRNSFDDCFAQLLQWLSDTEKKVNEYHSLQPNLQDKKIALHHYRNLQQDIITHQNIFKQLEEKAGAFSDEESGVKLNEILVKYNSLLEKSNELVGTSEKYVSNHENFLAALEKSRDFLRILISEEAISDKDGNEGKLVIIENLLSHKNDGEGLIQTCDLLLETVLKETDQVGHEGIISELEEHKEAWRLFLNRCSNNVAKLKQLCNKWDKLIKDLEELTKWVQTKEMQVKDQSLKSTYAAKQAHLEKLKSLDEEVKNKADEFSSLVSSSVEADAELADRVSKTALRYQALKNQSKEMLLRYEQYAKEHLAFDTAYKDFLDKLNSAHEELKQHNQIVGDLNALQEKQKKVRDLSDLKSRESGKYESILDLGEKLYSHTSPDGREIIRQQLRDLRSLWEALSENLQESLQILEQCLVQFAEFTLSQEQLTKWLKEVEKAMQAHTELKGTLQEKKAQLQNHKIMHQDILGNHPLITSVCDKAKNLVDQTKDTTLNVFLTSIQELFDNIVSKSQELLGNLETNVENHNEFCVKCQNLRDWIESEKGKLNQCDDCTGEKPDLQKRLEHVKILKGELVEGNSKQTELKSLACVIRKATTKKGQSLIDKERNKLETNHEKLIDYASNIEKNLEATIAQWLRFEEELENHTKWFRTVEAAFRNQQPRATLEEKQEQLESYKKMRDEITDHEVKIDSFVDDSNALLSSSGVDRIKPLISQISNRYQLLHVLSKEVINRCQSVVEDHKTFNSKLTETDNWLEGLEERLKNVEVAEGLAKKSGLLKGLATEIEQGHSRLSNLGAVGDRLHPDTAANGREIIRQQLRKIRSRWEALEEGVKAQQKLVDAQSLQWNTYQESLAQVLSWLDQMEKHLKHDSIFTLTSPNDIRSKLLRQKASLQEVFSHKRIIESVLEKAAAVGDETPELKTLSPRYESLIDQLLGSITQLEEYSDAVQVFSDLQKQHLDFQNQIKDRLATCTDYSGNRSMLQSRLSKVLEIKDNLIEGTVQLKGIEDHVNQNKSKIPVRAKEAMDRDVTNLKFSFDKITLGVSDVIQELESRMNQWTEYQTSLEKLQTWMEEAELSLKSYTPVSTLSEKHSNLAKYQSLLLSMRPQEEDLEKLNNSSLELAEQSSDSKISVSIQQITSRFQSIQSTCKELVKKCEQAVTDHESFNSKFKEASEWLNIQKNELEEIKREISGSTQNQLGPLSERLCSLLETKSNGTAIMNATDDAAEKLYSTTAVNGRDQVRLQVEELHTSFDSLYDSTTDIERQLKSRISSWSGIEERCARLQKWLKETESLLPNEPELKATLDEKRGQLQAYRAILQDANAHHQDLVTLRDNFDSLPEKNQEIEKRIQEMTKQHSDILNKAQKFVETYEGIVNTHQEYCKAVMEMQEWTEATNNTVLLWGDLDLERVSLHTNLDRLKNLEIGLREEEPRLEGIRALAEKVLPGTNLSGQGNIREQVDSSQQDWHSLLSAIQSTINQLESKLQQWSEYEEMKDQCLSWLRETDTKLHAVDLKATADEKKEQLELLKALQGEIRAKELEIDAVTDKAQQLHKPSTRSSHITELQHKYQQLSAKVKDLTNRWQGYVSRHIEFNSGIIEACQWLDGIKTRLQYCSDLSASSQEDLETKVELIQDLLLYKDEGFVRVQSCVELGQSVLVNTAPSGHEEINNALENLQQEWSNLATKMVDTKALLDDCIHKWAGFLEQIQQLNKTVEHLTSSYATVSEYQTTFSEKRTQLDKIKTLEERVRCEKIEVDGLKAKSAEMLASGQQDHAATQAQEILKKFDDIADKIRTLMNEREAEYQEHRRFKDAMEELAAWLARARERLPSLKSRSLSDKLALEDAMAPLQSLLNKRAQGELLVEAVVTSGAVAAASTSPEGANLINNDVKAITESFQSFFKDVLAQKEQLEAMVIQWKNYKDEYEKISDWLQQMDILVKAEKTALLGTAEEKKKQVETVKNIMAKLEKGQEQIDKINQIAAPLLSSHLDTYVNNQMRHLNSRYEVQLNLAKDVLRKVETNCEQHEEYEKNLLKARDWLNDAKEIIRESSTSAATASKDVLQARLAKIQELTNRREEGQSLIHATVNSGEKVLRATRSDGKEAIANTLKELQAEWERLVKKISTAKVHLETSLLQWADYSSSYSQLQQWISDREAKLMEVCEQKLSKAKRGQASGLASLSIVERKATLRQTNSIVQDIVSFEPMIQSVTSKAEDLQQAAPEITVKYESLSKAAKELLEKQRETVEGHQAFIDAGNEFGTWLRGAKEMLGKCAEAMGDKDSLANKLTQLKILQNEIPEGQSKLEKALQLGEVACALADADDKEVIEEEVVLLQDEFDSYVESVGTTKNLLETGIMKWTEYEDQYKEAVEWLSQTEESVQSFNKLQSTLEEKRTMLELFQGHLQTLFGWQQQLDNLNLKAQLLLETCSDTRVSNALMQLTTKYNALLSLAKEVMRRLELHYQEHQQHNSLYQECQQWIEKTKEKVATCSEMPNSIAEVNSRLGVVKGLQQALEQGQNRFRYALELKEKVILNTEPSGVAKIQEDTDSLKQEFDKLTTDVQNLRQLLTARAGELEEVNKLVSAMREWTNEMKLKAVRNDSSDICDTKAELEKFKGLLRQINNQSDLIGKIQQKLENDETIPRKDFDKCLEDYKNLKDMVTATLKELETEVKDYDNYLSNQSEAFDWVRKTRISVQSCSDCHGEREATKSKAAKLQDISNTFQEGESLVESAIEKGKSILNRLGPDGRDAIKNDSTQLKSSLESLRSLLRDTQSNIGKCLLAWEDYNGIRVSVHGWLEDAKLRVKKEVQDIGDGQGKTTEDLETVRKLMDEINGKKGAVEELGDKCEALMEMSACNWVRDETVKIQAEYTSLFLEIQELVSRVEKNLSDQTEFLKAKSDLEDWLQRSHGTVKDCAGVGSEEWTKDKITTIALVSNRITEGQHLMSVVEEVFKRALDRSPPEHQDSLRESVEVLHNSWDQLTMDLKSVTAQLKAALGRWEDFEESVLRAKNFLDGISSQLAEKYDTKAELGEMKTILERLKHIQNELSDSKRELERLENEAILLDSWAGSDKSVAKVNALKSQWKEIETVAINAQSSLEDEMKQHAAYHQALQDTEKWLLQVSFQLMAHNSLYITNKEQTMEQIQLHDSLLHDIIEYQSDLDDLRSKGYCQIERYVKTTPSIKEVIEQQLANVQESYNSLLHTAKQIKNRLDESLEKFIEYEKTLESIMLNLDQVEAELSSEILPTDELVVAKKQHEAYKVLQNKLEGEKTRLGAAIAACEAAAACISRPSSPQDPTTAPIPDREIAVRVRLEDLVDTCERSQTEPSMIRLNKIVHQLKEGGALKKVDDINFMVEGRLGTLNQLVSELEDKERKLAEIEDWITNQGKAVSEWSKKPGKLRADAAKAEISSMGALKNSIAEKRNLLLTAFPQGEHSTSVSKKLDDLETLLLETIAKKQSDEDFVESYRQQCSEAQAFLDNLIRDLEGVDKGRGLPLEGKLNSLQGILQNHSEMKSLTVPKIRSLMNNVIDIVSNLDAQQVEEQAKSIERRFNEIGKRIQRKMEILQSTQSELKAIEDEVNEAKSWVSEKADYVKNLPPVGYQAKMCDDRVHLLKALLKEAEGKQVLANSAEKRLQNISNELEPFEVESVSQQIQSLKSVVSDLVQEVKHAVEKANEAGNERKSLENKLSSVHEKLRNLYGCKPQFHGSHEPLLAAVVEKHILENKDYINKMKKIGEEELPSLQKQVSAVLKSCNPDDEEKLRSIVKAISEEHTRNVNEGVERDGNLKKLLETRLSFEASLEKIQQWLNQAEVSLSADVRGSSLKVIQEQLDKYSKLNKECQDVKSELEGLCKVGSEMKLSQADRLTLNDNLGTLEQRRSKIEADILKKLSALGEALENMKQLQMKVDKSNALIGKVKEEMKNLSKPLGCKIEDVQETIDAYQRLLDELKDWDGSLGDENIEGLEGVHGNLQDLIKLLEDEISRLRDLLRLRQQYLALVTDITTFITTYTPIVQDIETSNQPTQDKIKKLDDVILKIQACDATLASATDKGERIALEGSSADANAITSQLQSLKQQLGVLRKAVEAARERTINAERAYSKAMQELDALLDWLHAHELEVKQRPLLEIALESVDDEIRKHEVLASEVKKYLNGVEKLNEKFKSEEFLPDTLQERLSEASSLLHSLPVQLKDREQYLLDNKKFRITYNGLRQNFFDWIDNAERKLEIGKDGIDIGEIQNLLDDHNSYFSDEKSLHDLVSVEIHKAGSALLPSLGSEESEVLSARQGELGQSLRNILNSAKSRGARLNEALELSRLYKTALNTAATALERATFSDEPHNQMDVDLLNERMRELLPYLNTDSQAIISSEVASLNEDWASLMSNLESRRDTLAKLASLWEEFEGKLQKFESNLLPIDDKNKHIDMTIRCKDHLLEIKGSLESLLDSLTKSGSDLEEVKRLSQPIFTFLEAVSPSSAELLSTKISNTHNHHAR
ncbi:unnamed protein product [Nezara viridula]|uniref:Calponin-homology (CH) domain-containing protein n=1 Tax=Nezara viridula TaxID=85310 RepID=A0A9P0HKU9_NEZVI|nr:unnamed protein product [Nezara viridula]